MTREARLMSGIILITVPTIQYGGYFLLTSLMNKSSGYMENPLRQNFFRAGHAHAGVIVILSLVCQILADAAVLPTPLLWFVRIGVPLSAILISAGFFFSVLPPTATQASGAVSLIYAGALILAVASCHAGNWSTRDTATRLDRGGMRRASTAEPNFPAELDVRLDDQSRQQSDSYHGEFLRLGSSYCETVCIEGLESHRLHARPKEGKRIR